jgi:hypothetical protein
MHAGLVSVMTNACTLQMCAHNRWVRTWILIYTQTYVYAYAHAPLARTHSHAANTRTLQTPHTHTPSTSLSPSLPRSLSLSNWHLDLLNVFNLESRHTALVFEKRKSHALYIHHLRMRACLCVSCMHKIHGWICKQQEWIRTASCAHTKLLRFTLSHMPSKITEP